MLGLSASVTPLNKGEHEAAWQRKYGIGPSDPVPPGFDPRAETRLAALRLRMVGNRGEFYSAACHPHGL